MRARDVGASPCILERPPESAWLDRLALWLEGGGVGEPASALVDLDQVLSPEQLATIPKIAAFYRDPDRYVVRAGLVMGPWSRILMRVFGSLARQCRVPARAASFEGFPICQRVYRDAKGRPHWDRYARVAHRLERLFVARLETIDHRVRETFVLYGVPVPLVFDATVDGGALTLTLTRLRSSPLAWPARVTYRTAPVDGAGALRTEGDFRVALLGLRVRTVFHMEPAAAAPGADAGGESAT